MAISLHELLSPQVILSLVSRIREGQGQLGRWLGWQPTKFNPDTVSIDGPNTIKGNVRYATFRVFDHTRVLPKGRAPGTGPATVPMNPVGEVPVACARFHEKIPVLYEELGNLSPMIGPNAQIDTMGQDYVMRQARILAVKMNNGVELMATGMLQDSLYFQQQGDNWIPQIGQPSSGVWFQIPFQVPAGNKAQLNMLGTGNIIGSSWANAGTPIYGHISSIKMAFAQLHGWPLSDVWVNSGLWYRIISNTEIRNLAGTAATPFAEFDMKPEKGYDGEDTGQYYGVLKADPTIKWHINDMVLAQNTDVDPSYATAPSTANFIKMVPDNMAFFLTKPSSLWQRLYHGAEPVVENPGQPAVLRKGYYFWKEYVTQPSAIEMLALLNAVPTLMVPRLVTAGQVIF